MNIGQRVAWLRARSNQSQEQLAASSGVSRKRISEIELEKGSPTIETLEKVLKGCGVTLSEFFRTEAVQYGGAKDLHEKLDLVLGIPSARGFMRRLIEMAFRDAVADQDGFERPETAEEPKPAPALVVPSKEKKMVTLHNFDAPQPVMTVRVPYYDRIPAGDPVQMDFGDAFWIDIVHSSSKPGWWTTRVWGDSMLPEYKDGDIILMDRDQAPRDGDIVAALIDGSDATLKVFSRHGEEITLTPLNTKRFKPRTYEAERVTVQGVLVELVRRRRKRR